jgi:FMN-dependent NADH-azoreductase
MAWGSADDAKRTRARKMAAIEKRKRTQTSTAEKKQASVRNTVLSREAIVNREIIAFPFWNYSFRCVKTHLHERGKS